MIEKLKSKEWRLDHLYKIKSKKGDVITFKMNSAQRHYFHNRHSRNVILKSRQLGFTTFEIIDQLDDMLFTTDNLFACSFVAHKKDDAEKIFQGKLKFAWDRLPEEIKMMYKIKKDTAEDFILDLGDNHINEAQVSVSVRSGTNQRIHISELSYPDKHDPAKAKEIIWGAVPTLSSDGMLTIESTARGLSGQFYDIFTEAWKKHKDDFHSSEEYKAHFYNWTWDDYEMSQVTDEVIKQLKDTVPEYVEQMAEKHNMSLKEKICYYRFYMRCNGDIDFLKQEYPITVEEAFEGSVINLFSPEAVKKMPDKAGRKEGDWTFFKPYIKGHVYGLGADVAEGVGKDSSTIVIWDFTPLYKRMDSKPEVVATYASNTITPTEFAYQIMNGGNKYGNCLVAPERNNHGHAVIGQLRQIYQDKNIFSLGQDMTKSKNSFDTRYGFLTTQASKSIMLNELNDAVNQEIIDVWSKQIKVEMISYDKEDVNQTKKKKDQTNHWDLLIAAAIGWQLRRYVKIPKVEEEVYREKTHDPYE